jgi:SAM-dependent methyltransferase
MGLRQARPAGLLAFGERFPDKYPGAGRSPVVASQLSEIYASRELEMDFIMRLLRMLVSLLGINPRTLLSIRYFARYIADARHFKSAGGKVDQFFPILSDYRDSAGVAIGHYFYQDLVVAQRIFSRNPRRHVDVGSRIDGFVAHVASFREIEMFDIRPLETSAANIRFTVQDIAALPSHLHEYADSVSCLNALEHFGLGRYGDSIDPNGHIKGFENLLNLTRPGGILYVAVPVGLECTVFNAHRILAPLLLVTLAGRKAVLDAFSYVDDAGDLHTGEDVPKLLQACERLRFGLGIYEFRKLPWPGAGT